MSSKSKPPARTSVMPATAAEHAHGPGHEHDDDLIVAPKGSNRLRFILTVFLVLFVLVMFVVADLFQFVIGGGGRNRANPTYLTWHDPLSGEDEASDDLQFNLTRRMLSQLASMGLYSPPSAAANFRSRSDVDDNDVASFLVYEDLAEDAGIAISDKEHRDLLFAIFQTSENLVARARDYQMLAKELEDAIRRVRRVDKLKDLLRSGTRLADPDKMIAAWQESHTQHQFQYAVLATEEASAEASATPPTDEELMTWWRTQPAFEQQQLYTEEKTVPQVAWLDLAGSFDETALITAFPRPDGTDEELLARTYYDRYRAVRFLNPDPPATPETTGDVDSAKAQAFLEFEAVRDTALREAKIEAALADLIKDLEQRVGKGEAIDLGVEAARFGMESFTSPDPLTRAQLTTPPPATTGEQGPTDAQSLTMGWANPDLGQRLAFGPAGKMLGNVVVNGTRMYLGRVIERTPRAEQPIEAIRELVLKKWTTFRAGELTLERAKALVATLAEKPADHPEDQPWNPVVDVETFNKVLTEAGLTVVERPWLEQREAPPDSGPMPSDVDRFFQSEATEFYALPEGAVGAPKRAQAGDKVYIVRHSGQRPKPASDLTPKDLAAPFPQAPTLLQRTSYEAMSDLSEKIFQGDSEWFTARFQVRFPAREQREAENAATEPAKPAPGA
jgi:hypothetical protein